MRKLTRNIGIATFLVLGGVWLLGSRQPEPWHGYLIGGVVGSAATALLALFVNLVSSDLYRLEDQNARRAEVKRRREEFNNLIDKSQSSPAIHLESNPDCYEIENESRHVVVNERKTRYFLRPPRDYCERIQQADPTIEFRGPDIFGTTSLDGLAERTGIHGFPELIDQCRHEVAQLFVDRLQASNQPLYNNTKFGIYSLSFTRKGQNEDPHVRLTVYETDYYTHAVMRYVYRKLVQLGHPIGKLVASEVGAESSPYQCFTTSFGINAMVLIHNRTKLVLARRSRSGINPEANDKWHVSMNEGFSQTDRDPHRPSLALCLKRGLKEELGIDDDVSWSAKFFEFWLWRAAFEVSVSAIVETDLTRDELEARACKAVDAVRERWPAVSENISSEFKYIDYDEKGINTALENLDLTDGARFILRNLTTMGCPERAEK